MSQKNIKFQFSISFLGNLFVLMLLFFVNQALANTEQEKTSRLDHPYNLIIDDIICRNNINTQCSFITKKYYQEAGERVDPNEIADAKLRLGTLFQFKNIRVTLEKSKQRNHVIVVFIVDEADQVQYSISSAYSGAKSSITESGALSVSTGVTDFNFLGSGKQLGFQVGKQHYYFNGDVFQNATNDTLRELTKTRIDSIEANLSYYDPHLFGSVEYYFSANLNYRQQDSSFQGQYWLASDGKGSFKNNSYQGGMAIGKRFGRNSNIEFHTSFRKGVNKPRASINYGWDSRDDILFPTRGSLFTAQYSGLNADSKGLHLSYENNISFSKGKVFSYALSGNVISNSLSGERRTKVDPNAPYLRLMISDIDERGASDGRYSGWKYYLNTTTRKSDLGNANLGVSYVRQTDKLILQFNLSYTTDWSDLL